MDNEAQLSTAVVTAPHDTLLPKALDGCEGFLEAEIGVLGAAIVPPVFSPLALHVADAQEYWGAWLHGRLKRPLQWTDLTRAAVLSSSWQAIRCHGFARDTRSAFGALYRRLGGPSWPRPYHRYHGFWTQESPVARTVIMHCSNDVNVQVTKPWMHHGR